MKAFLIALQFLTSFPIKIKSEIKEEDFGKSLAYFPVVGMVIGLGLALCLYVFSFLPSLVRAAMLLAISIIVTGGIHLDGLADTCDGFCAGRSKEKILEIMRDSNMGAMGVIGIVLVLLLKVSFFYSIPFNLLWKALIIMVVWGRNAQVLCCFLSDYARVDGKAKFFIKYATKREVFFSAVFTFGLTLLLMRLRGILLFVILTMSSLLFISYIKKRIGGMTGDTVGAVSEITELTTLFFTSISAAVLCF